jgi:hypothetical protein
MIELSCFLARVKVATQPRTFAKKMRTFAKRKMQKMRTFACQSRDTQCRAGVAACHGVSGYVAQKSLASRFSVAV